MSSRAQRTRERILAASLALFNARGAPHAATGEIAQELGISPGNLHYHFRRKSDIVRELVERFRVRSKEILVVPAAVHVEDAWLFLHLLFEQVRDFRFLFRDLEELASRDPALRGQYAEWIAAVAATARGLYRGLSASGALRATEPQIEALAESTAMTAAYWLSYCAVRDPGALRGDPIGRGVYQAMSGLEPFLVGEARLHFGRLSRDYL